MADEALMAILAKPKKGAAMAEDEGVESDLELAAGDFQAAVKSGSAAEVVEAFKALKMLCEEEYATGEEE